MFFSKNKTEIDEGDLTARLIHAEEKCQALTGIAETLVYFIKEFSLDIKEIDATSFKQKMDELTQAIKSEEDTGTLEHTFQRHRKTILEFVSKEHSYLEKKEADLKEVIEMLRGALSEVVDENQAFNSSMYESNVRIEQISRLSDIARLKEGLMSEIGQAKHYIRNKQASDETRVQRLSKEIDSLKTHLEQARDAQLNDPLTGAYNRLGFDIMLERYFQRSGITGRKFSMLMCDIDDFKKINDSYGHQVGDIILQLFVKLCKIHVRNDDVIARYGGEEFVLMLPDAGLKDATKRASDICKAVSSQRFKIEGMKALGEIGFTVSIGVSERHKSDSSEMLIRRADEALYTAKRSGKNRAIDERSIRPDLIDGRKAA